MATKAQINKIVKDFSAIAADVKNQYDKFYSKEIELGREEKVADKRALRMVELHFKKGSIGGPTSMVRMIVLGTKESMDSANKTRMTALETWEENPTKAIKEGYTDQEGTPLDMKKDFGAGNPNKNFGKPLKPNWMRIIFGFNLDTKKEMTFILKGDQAINMEVPYFKVVELTGKLNDKTGIWNGAKSTKLTIVEEPTLSKAEKEFLNIETLVTKHLKGLKQDVESIEEWCSIHGNKDVLITEADVIDIDMELNAGNSRTIILDNETDYGQRVFCPEHIPIDFGEMSRILIVASAKPGKEDYGPTMTAMGLYAIPEYKYEPENVESADSMIDHSAVTDENETDEEGESVDIGNSDDTDEDLLGEPETDLKVATPALILKVISSSEAMTKDAVCESAKKNGFSPESAAKSIETLISDGEIECTKDTGYLIISEDEDTYDDMWGK
jgi:hypothetical protein